MNSPRPVVRVHEAHRFAITFHRSKRSKVMLESLLDGIPSLGEVRRRSILEHFGSVTALRKATKAEISEIPGIGERTAEIILANLQPAADSVDMATGEILDASDK